MSGSAMLSWKVPGKTCRYYWKPGQLIRRIEIISKNSGEGTTLDQSWVEAPPTLKYVAAVDEALIHFEAACKADQAERDAAQADAELQKMASGQT